MQEILNVLVLDQYRVQKRICGLHLITAATAVDVLGHGEQEVVKDGACDVFSDLALLCLGGGRQVLLGEHHGYLIEDPV